MAGRWSDPSAFRADPAATPATRPSRRQTLALLAVLLAVAGAVVAVSYAVRPERARAFDLLHGSLFLADEQSPVAVDLPSGKPTLRLVGAAKQVGITGNQTLGVVPLEGGTLLLNRTTGEFNMVDSSGFVVKHDGGGVPLGPDTLDMSAIGVAAGDLAYVARNTPGRTDVYLVSQATVTSAINATAAVTPRASTFFTDGAVDTDPGGAVSAGPALWVLVRLADGRFAVRQLTYPPSSNPGAKLTATAHGVVSGPAALTTATTSGGTSVGLATPDRLTIFTGGSTHTVRFPPPATVDKILSATNRGDRLAFLMHGAAGWFRLSVAADGSDLRGPTAIAGMPAGAQLAQPAYSADALYTMDQANGRIYRIDSKSKAGAIPGAASYPLATVKGVVAEQSILPDGYVIARQSRVIFNSGSHAKALIVFTDGSHPPQQIEKSDAVQVSASGGAEQLTKSTVNPGVVPPTNNGSKSRTSPAQVVNPHLDCKNVSQKPHIPVIGPVQRGSRSVTLSWTYPIVDKTQDCYPTTYVVSVKLLSPDAPQPPSSVTVESQVGAMITGLFPLSDYEFTVTAYIHGQHTSSAPFQVRTGPEGPAAPTGLTVAADSSGGWVLNWNSCGSVEQGCVPAQNWTVTPSICDGRGLSSPPTPLSAPADPSSRKQPTARYAGGDALLGRGLRFVVTGSGESQVEGTPSARSACIYSWSPAIPGAMRLSASQPANTSLGGSTTTNVTLDLGANPVRDVGGVGAQVTFTLTGNGGSQTKQATFTGNQTSLSVNFGGIQAGAAYTASATVRPAHGGTTVAIPSVGVSTRADWPNVTLSAVCRHSALTSCDLTLQISGISSAAARGERFDFNADVACGSGGPPSISRTNFDPADVIDGGSIDLLTFYGTCQIHGTLKENASAPSPQVFGGKPLAPLDAPVDLGAPPTSGAGQGDFDVAWGSGRGNGDTPINITYQGQDDLRRLTNNWSETVTPPGGGGCGPDGNDTPNTTLVVTTACIADTGAGGGNWTVQISYSDRSTHARQGPFTYALPNPVPGYQYCAPTGFDPNWNPAKPAGVAVNAGGGDLSGCSGWRYTLQSQPPGASDPTTCGTAGGAPPQTVLVDCDDDPTQGSWTVVVSWLDAANRRQTSDPIPVSGSPPTP